MKLYGEEFPEIKFRCSKLFTDHKSQIVALIVELTEWTNGFCVDITKSIMKSSESYESKIGASSGPSNTRLITHIHTPTTETHTRSHWATWESFRPGTASPNKNLCRKYLASSLQQCNICYLRKVKRPQRDIWIPRRHTSWDNGQREVSCIRLCALPPSNDNWTTPMHDNFWIMFLMSHDVSYNIRPSAGCHSFDFYFYSFGSRIYLGIKIFWQSSNFF